MEAKGKLLDALDTYFNLAELQELCFDLGVEYENLAGTTKRSKAMELIGYMERVGRTAELINYCQTQRPRARAAFEFTAAPSQPVEPVAGDKSQGSGAISQGNQNIKIGAGGIYVAGNVGGDIVTGQKITQTQGQAPRSERSSVSPALEMARRSLAILEEQAAGYTTLTIPAHLRLELEDKRRQVAELEKQM
jgi:hypothetical protein